LTISPLEEPFSADRTSTAAAMGLLSGETSGGDELGVGTTIASQ